MTTPTEDNSPTIESIAVDQRRLLNAVEALTRGQDSSNKAVEALTRGQNSLSKAVLALSSGMNHLSENAKKRNSLNSKFETFIDETSHRLDGLRDDIAMVRGGHAVGATHRNAPLIADDLDCQLIEELPRGVILALAKVAADNGEAINEVDSFRHADMVMHVKNARSQPGYIAVEASFTVDTNDVRRAARNAEYLHKYTGLLAYAVVAGVDVLPEAQERIDKGDAHLWRIEPRHLQPE